MVVIVVEIMTMLLIRMIIMMIPMILREKITEREENAMTLLKSLATLYFPL